MAFSIRDRMGRSVVDPPLDRLPALIGQLDAFDDDEHPDVSVEHQSGWGLSAFPSGLVIWENVEEDGEPRHLTDVPRERLLELFQAVAAGDLPRVEREPWRPGYG